jgi:hypothetical protein
LISAYSSFFPKKIPGNRESHYQIDEEDSKRTEISKPEQIPRKLEGNDFDHSFDAPRLSEDWTGFRVFGDEIAKALCHGEIKMGAFSPSPRMLDTGVGDEFANVTERFQTELQVRIFHECDWEAFIETANARE